MKSTTKAIFSLGLISFLTLGGICQNAFAAEVQAGSQPQPTTTAKPSTTKKPVVKTHTKKPVVKTHTKKPVVKTHTEKPIKK